jgi:hypothetical protein
MRRRLKNMPNYASNIFPLKFLESPETIKKEENCEGDISPPG